MIMVIIVVVPVQQLQPPHPTRGQQHGQDHRQDGAQALAARRSGNYK